MFTGIIQQVGAIESVSLSGGTGTLRIRGAEWTPSLAIGESVAVEGVCLTLTEPRGHTLLFDLLRETLDRTNLGRKKTGDRVNLERALRVGDPLGGHFVTGHVDATGTVRKITPVGRDWILEIQCAPEWMGQMIPKGSIAVSGVSLTLVDVMRDAFTVHLIPHTWSNTSLSALRAGDAVNLETDMLGKYVQRLLDARASR